MNTLTRACIAWEARDLLHKSQHDGLGHHVDHSPADDVVIAGDKKLDDLDLLRLLLAEGTTGLEGRWRWLHSRHLLLVLAGEERAEEAGADLVAVERGTCGPWWDGGGWKRLAGLGVDLRWACGHVTLVDDCHSLYLMLATVKNGSGMLTYPVSVQEVRVSCVDVARLHSHKIPDKLVRRIHNLLEEANDNSVQLLLERWISPEQRLVQ